MLTDGCLICQLLLWNINNWLSPAPGMDTTANVVFNYKSGAQLFNYLKITVPSCECVIECACDGPLACPGVYQTLGPPCDTAQVGWGVQEYRSHGTFCIHLLHDSMGI